MAVKRLRRLDIRLDSATILNAIHVEATKDNLANMDRLRRAVKAVIVDHLGGTEQTFPEDVEAVAEQAIIQMCGYIWESPAAAPARINFANALHNSGAAGLLAQWRTHWAGVIGAHS